MCKLIWKQATCIVYFILFNKIYCIHIVKHLGGGVYNFLLVNPFLNWNVARKINEEIKSENERNTNIEAIKGRSS